MFRSSRFELDVGPPQEEMYGDGKNPVDCDDAGRLNLHEHERMINGFIDKIMKLFCKKDINPKLRKAELYSILQELFALKEDEAALMKNDQIISSLLDNTLNFLDRETTRAALVKIFTRLRLIIWGQK